MMKFLKKFAVFFIVLVLLNGCAQTKPEATVQPEQTEEMKEEITEEKLPEEEPSEMTEEKPLFSFIELENAVPVSFDIDLDGEMEKVAFYETETGEFPTAVTVEETDGIVYDFTTDYLYETRVFVGNFDFENQYLLFHGDVASADYESYCLRYADGQFTICGMQENALEEAGTVLYAYVDLINEDGTIVFKKAMDYLGTWVAERTFVMKDGAIIPCEGSLWEIHDTETYHRPSIKTMIDIPVVFMENGTETAGSLAAQTEIYITAVTDDDKVLFITAIDGKEGCIQLSAKDYEWTIEGISEYDCFEYLPYAG